jgi:hypothetical protein
MISSPAPGTMAWAQTSRTDRASSSGRSWMIWANTYDLVVPVGAKPVCRKWTLMDTMIPLLESLIDLEPPYEELSLEVR